MYRLESSLAENYLEILIDGKLNMNSTVYLGSQKGQPNQECIRLSTASWVREGVVTLCSAAWREKHINIREHSKESHKDSEGSGGQDGGLPVGLQLPHEGSGETGMDLCFLVTATWPVGTAWREHRIQCSHHCSLGSFPGQGTSNCYAYP